MKRRDFVKTAAALGAVSFAPKFLTGSAFAGERDYTGVGEDLAARADEIFITNRVDTSIGTFHLPSAETYRSFFAWDSGWNVIANSLIDPDSALAELETIFSTRFDNGMIPHEVRTPELKDTDPVRKVVIYTVRRQYDDEGRSRFIDPPSFLLAAEILYERTNDKRILEMLPAMRKCAEYLTGERDLFGDGLVSIIHPWESGTDSAPVFDAPLGININSPTSAIKYATKYPGMLNKLADMDWDLKKAADKNIFVFEDMGMNGITAAGLIALANLEDKASAGAGGKWREKAKNMVAAMEKINWDEKASFFYPRYDRKSPKLSYRRCLTGVAPLLTGMVSDDKAEALIENNLLSPEHFNADWLVPFNSMSELEGEKIPLEDVMLWRGHCIWANMNWIAARACSMYGREEVAKKITRRTIDLVLKSGFREFWDYRDGEGGGAPGFTWPALVLDMIETHGV